MKPSPNLRLANSDQPTRQQVAMAAIERDMGEWSPQGWHPVDVAARNPLTVDDTLARSYRMLVDVAAPVPAWRRAWRWVSGKVGRR